MKSPEIDILLSTYNGAPYLMQQLDSLFKQTCQDWNVLVRDDGSTDGTLNLLKDVSRQDSRILLIEENDSHLGACQGFAYLMRKSTSKYCMFCDQDDIWLPEKIQTMLSEMHRIESIYGNMPILVVSDLIVVDEKMNIIAPSFWKFQRVSPIKGNNFPSMVIQNKYPGCSMLFNRRLRELMQYIPEQAVMHDWWVAIGASAFGRIAVVQKPLTYYRQHRHNTIGLPPTGSISGILKSIYRIITFNPIALEKLRSIQDSPEILACRAFQLQYAEKLTKGQVAVLQSLGDHSLVGIFKYGIFRETWQSNLNLLVLLLLLKLMRKSHSTQHRPT